MVMLAINLVACGDDKEDGDKEITPSIVGTWKLTVDKGYTHTHVTFTKDGTFSYTSTDELDYEEHGTYKIVDNLLYQMFSDEDEWVIGEILLLNSETLSIQDLDDDGVTPRGKPYSYQRVEQQIRQIQNSKGGIDYSLPPSFINLTQTSQVES